MSLIFTLGIILVLSPALKADPKCHLNELWQCEEMIEEELNSLPKRTIPHTEEQVAQMCSTLQKSTECAKKFRDNCMTPIQKELLDLVTEGMVVSKEEVCNPDTDIHKKYMEHVECLNKVSQMDELKDEIEHVLAVMEMAEGVSFNKRITYSCCAYSQTYNAFLTLVRGNCGKDATDTIENIISMAFAQLPEVLCNGFDGNDDQCKSILPPEGAKPSGNVHSALLDVLKDKFQTWLE